MKLNKRSSRKERKVQALPPENIMKRIAILTAVTFLAISCLASNAAADLFGFGRSNNGSGQLERETRELDSFESIRLQCSIDVHVIIGSKQSVVVVADDNLLKYIETDVDRRGTLWIDSDESFDSRFDLVVEITVPSLKQLRISGSGDVIIEEMQQEFFDIHVSGSGDITMIGDVEELDISISGSGDIELEGEGKQANIRISGSGDIDARDFIVEEVEVRINGSGDVEVYATEYFDGSISGSGDITVYGSPKHMSRDISGSGDIRKRR